MSASLLHPPQGGTDDVDPALLTIVGELGDHLGRTVHALQRARAQMAASGGEGVTEWSSRAVLAKVVTTGPKRVSDLAELVGVDASTVSRQVAGLVKEGLLARQADPDDGRASLLVATADGHAAMAEFRAGRNRDLVRVLRDWTAEDLQTFSDHLDRFADDIGEHLSCTTAEQGHLRGARSEGDRTS